MMVAGRTAVTSPGFKAAVLTAGAMALSVQPSVMLAAGKAVFKLVSSCAIGYNFSKRGVLDQAALTSLSRLIFYIFQPCLLFVNVASALAMPGQKYSTLFVLPVVACLQIIAGSLVAIGLAKALGIEGKSSEGRELRMCSSFANSGPLPLLFADSLFGSHADPTLLPTAVAYISFYLLGWSPMFWTAGYGMLAGTPPPLPALASGDPWAETGLRQLTLAQTAVVAAQKLRASPTFKRIISPPVLGCIAGAAVGMCPPVYALLIGPRAIFSPVFESLKALGAAYLPAAILVLAGSLARPGSKVAAGPPGSVGGGGSVLPKVENSNPFAQLAFLKRVGAIMVSRFVFMPLVVAAILLTGSRVGAVPYDRMLWFVLLMEGCMPSAQNSVVILQMEKKPDLASSMARTLTVVYLLSAVPIAMLLSGILQFVQL
ncbi:unnamed protein product [Phaeothamnion confervicola]